MPSPAPANVIPAGQRIHRHQHHLRWSRSRPPVLTVSSGDVVTFDSIDGSNGQIDRHSDADVLERFDVSRADPVVGPVYVQGAERGDVLQIDILDLQTADWGWTAILPGFGLLADEFPDPVLKIWHLEAGQPWTRSLAPGVRVSTLRPFLGVMGVAPAEEGDFSIIPPLDTGGNLDCRHLTVGSTLFLPVRVAGALFSCGDGHAAQGDGEVCGTAIETSVKATLRFTVCRDQPWVTAPHFQTPASRPGQAGHDEPDEGQYAAMGIDSDLREAARKAVRSLVDWLVHTRHLSRTDAYMLASVAGDLKIAEAVDMPNYAVAMVLPLNVFES